MDEGYRFTWQHVVIADAVAVTTCLILVYYFVGFEGTGILPAIISPVLSVVMSIGIVMWANGAGSNHISGLNWESMNDDQKSYACSVMGLCMAIGVTLIGCAVPMVMMEPMGVMWFALLISSGVIVMFAGMIWVLNGTRIGDRKYRPKSATAVWGLFIMLLFAIISVPIMITEAEGASNVTVDLGDDKIAVRAPLTEFSIAYSDISSVELDDDFDIGTKTSGFSDMRISAGTYRNSTLGTYRLAAYDACAYMIVIHTNGGSHYAFNQSSAYDTMSLYDDIMAKLS